MPGEFTNHCSLYYQLDALLDEREHNLAIMLDNAPPYCGQTDLEEMDALLSYYREVGVAKAETDKTAKALAEAGRTVLMIMQYFEIPPGTVLNGKIDGELAYEIWADEDDTVNIRKTKDLAPEADDPNTIVIKFSGMN